VVITIRKKSKWEIYMKKIILSIMIGLSSYVIAETGMYDCDSVCMNGVNMIQNNNTTTGTQTTTSKGFNYFTGTSCSGYNLMNNFSDGSQTLKQSNSSTCGYVASTYSPPAYDPSDYTTGFCCMTIQYFDPYTSTWSDPAYVY
jgi:hypothetical protein